MLVMCVICIISRVCHNVLVFAHLLLQDTATRVPSELLINDGKAHRALALSGMYSKGWLATPLSHELVTLHVFVFVLSGHRDV